MLYEVITDSTVYIAPPAKQMRVVKGKIVLTDEPPAYFARPSIDILFESLGVEYKSGLIAVLLSGYNNDGTHCLNRITSYNVCYTKLLRCIVSRVSGFSQVSQMPAMANGRCWLRK